MTRTSRTRTRRVCRRVAAMGWGVALPLLSSLSHAAPVDDANRRLVDLEERTRSLTTEVREQNAVDPNAAERRLVEAQTYHQLKNYDVAATLCLDIIDRHPTARVYDEALVLLGDSLFKSNDFLSARRYFLEAAKKRTGSRYEQEALQRLIEIALRTGDLDGVDGYLDRLAQIPPAQLQPSVPYVRGKYLFARDQLDAALVAFNAIPQTNPYYLQARYFAATIRVKKGDLASALQAYDEVLRFQPRNDGDREVQDLARLALGRIYYDRGQFDRARDAYNAVSPKSKHSAEAFEESAWNSIKAKDYKAAFRALDLMLLQNPDNPRAPELRLLVGQLNLRLSNFFVASEEFGKSRDEFEPMYRQLVSQHDKAKNDPAYFEGLIGKGLERFDIALFVPPGAVKWAKAEPDVVRMLALADEVGALQRDLQESERIVQNLERAVGGRSRVNVFADLASVRLRSTEVLNQTIDIRRRFMAEARKMAEPVLAPEDLSALEASTAERQRLEKELKDLPLTEGDLRKREGQVRGEFDRLDGQASELNVVVQSMNAEIVAIEQYYINSRAEQKIRPEDLKQPVADLKEELQNVRTALDRTRSEIADSAREANLAGVAYGADRDKAIRLGEVMREEYEILLRVRYRLSGADQKAFDARTGIIRRADMIQARLAELDQRLDGISERRLVDVRQKLDEQKVQLGVANTKLTGVLGESQSVGGTLAQVMLGRITDRFYDLTVQSDVGLIDVSWGLKDQKTGTLSKLINQQKLELKSVEDDFRSLLEEEK